MAFLKDPDGDKRLAALQSLAPSGHPDRIFITTDNRTQAKRWLSGLGFPSASYERMTLKTLSKCLGAALGSKAAPAYLCGVLRNAGADQEEIDATLRRLEYDADRMGWGGLMPGEPLSEEEAAEILAEGEPKPVQAPTPRPAQAPLPGLDPQKAAALEALTALLGGGQSVDPEQVQAIVREAMEKEAAAIIERAGLRKVALEIKADDGLDPVRIEGGHYLLPRLVKIASVRRANGHRVALWLVGEAGTGKSRLGEDLATALKLDFYSTGAVRSPFLLTGFMNGSGEYVRTAFRDAFEHGGVFVWDEVDASDPNALLAFNQALSNGIAAFPDGMVKRHPDFLAICTANTFGTGATARYVGRNKIDAAFRDRFIQIEVDYDPAIEAALSGGNVEWLKRCRKVRAAVRALGIDHMVTPRAIEHGAVLIQAGDAMADVEAATIFAGLAPDTVRKIEEEARRHSGEPALASERRAA